MITPTAYPLHWPSTRARTPAAQRTVAKFRTGGGSHLRRDGAPKPVTLVDARERLQDQLDLLRAQDVTLSTNLQLRLDGQPRAGLAEPDDPGVALYFRLGKKPIVLCCDRWATVAQNIAAIAAHIDALRGQERWGVATREESFAGFVALPAPGPGQQDWRTVLGLAAHTGVDSDVVRSAYTALAREHHPDRPGGSASKMATINAARDAALQELGA